MRRIFQLINILKDHQCSAMPPDFEPISVCKHFDDKMLKIHLFLKNGKTQHQSFKTSIYLYFCKCSKLNFFCSCAIYTENKNDFSKKPTSKN